MRSVAAADPTLLSGQTEQDSAPSSSPDAWQAHNRTSLTREEHNESLDSRLFTIVSGILVLLALLCIAGLAVQVRSYHEGMTKALNESTVDAAAVLTYARALDAAIVKTSALFLGYVLVFTGALYVLRIAGSHYRLSVQSGQNSGSLETSSPGLVIITLGVFLVAVAILNKTSAEYGQTKQTTSQAAPAVGIEGSATDPNFIEAGPAPTIPDGPSTPSSKKGK